MEKLLERFLPEAERQKIESCIRLAESRTRGEIMVLVEESGGGPQKLDSVVSSESEP